MAIIKLDKIKIHSGDVIGNLIDDVNTNLDSLVVAINDINGGQGVIGPQGEAGPQGLPGRDGVDGRAGQDGKDGQNGTDGINGIDGKDGAVGPQGIHGLPGAQGPAGKDGNPGVAGAKGDTGAQGVQGLPGRDGANGKDGINGTNGLPGTQGAQGVAGPSGIGIKGFASGYVNAGTFVTLDNIKATVTGAWPRGLSVATVSGTMNLSISGSYALAGGASGNATTYPGPLYTTTPSGSWFNWGFGNAGDASTYLVNDYTNKKFYRITLMIGASYIDNFISIEKLGEGIVAAPAAPVAVGVAAPRV